MGEGGGWGVGGVVVEESLVLGVWNEKTTYTKLWPANVFCKCQI